MRAHAGPARAAAFCGWVVMGGCLAVCLPFFFSPPPIFRLATRPTPPHPGSACTTTLQVVSEFESWFMALFQVVGYGRVWVVVGWGGRCVGPAWALCVLAVGFLFEFFVANVSSLAHCPRCAWAPTHPGVQIAHNDGTLGFLSSGSRDGSGLPWRGQARCGSRGYSKDPAILALRVQGCCTPQAPPPLPCGVLLPSV